MTFHPNDLHTPEMAQASKKSGWLPSLCFHDGSTHYQGSRGAKRDYTFTPHEGINNMHSIFAVGWNQTCGSWLCYCAMVRAGRDGMIAGLSQMDI